MRGDDQQSGHLFSYLSPEQRVPADHPLRAIRQMTDEALRQLSPQFEAIYATTGRPSVPPEQLLRALLLQALYTVRSERLLVEQLEYNLLFRWFVGLGMDDAVWTPTTFTKNRERLLAGDIARQFFAAVLAQARGVGCSPTSTSPWTARCSRRGPGRRASRGRTARAPARRMTIPAIRPSISAASAARTRPTSRRPTPTAVWRRRRAGAKRSSRISAKC